MVKAVIIYYHEIVKENGYSYQKINISHFEEQMLYLFNNPSVFNVISFDDLLNGKCDKKKINVIISFDDGFKSVYSNARPILNRYNFPYTIYLATGLVGKNGYLSLDEVQSLDNDSNVSFQAHTHNHIDCKHSAFGMIVKDIDESDLFFEYHHMVKPTIFCFPYGNFSTKNAKLLFKLNRYKMLLGSFYGFVKIDEKKVTPRIGIKDEDDMRLFLKKLKGKRNWKGPLQRIRMLLRF